MSVQVHACHHGVATALLQMGLVNDEDSDSTRLDPINHCSAIHPELTTHAGKGFADVRIQTLNKSFQIYQCHQGVATSVLQMGLSKKK